MRYGKIKTIDTTDASTCPADKAPGIYLFAMRGGVPGPGDGPVATMVEEFSIGLYATNESELDIEVENGQLHVIGDASNRAESDNEYLHQGIALRNFDRTFTIAENVEIKGAVVKNGLLAIDMEHIIPESAKPKKIAITFQK